jgi:hypothetical protein
MGKPIPGKKVAFDGAWVYPGALTQGMEGSSKTVALSLACPVGSPGIF